MSDTHERGGCDHVDRDLLRRDLSDAALELAAAGFAALWRGRPVFPAELLPGRDTLAAEVADALVRQGRAEMDDDRLVGVHGITLRATRHRFVHRGRSRHTWCAFDSIGIPAALRLHATAHTDCPTCGRALTVEIVDGIPDDEDAVLWLPDSTQGNLISDFCARADLYCSPEHLHQRVDTARTPGTVADLAAAVTLGCDVWADVAGFNLDRDKQRPGSEIITRDR